MMTTTALTLTDARIESLRTEAGERGDDALVRLCDAALAGGDFSGAWYDVLYVIQRAEIAALEDGEV